MLWLWLCEYLYVWPAAFIVKEKKISQRKLDEHHNRLLLLRYSYIYGPKATCGISWFMMLTLCNHRQHYHLCTVLLCMSLQMIWLDCLITTEWEKERKETPHIMQSCRKACIKYAISLLSSSLRLCTPIQVTTLENLVGGVWWGTVVVFGIKKQKRLEKF